MADVEKEKATTPPTTSNGHATPPKYSSDGDNPIDKTALAAKEVMQDDHDPDFGKSPEERAKIDRALLWKIDLLIVPWMCLLYLLSFLDRTNIGNARLAGMEEDLGMEGHDYNIALTIFVCPSSGVVQISWWVRYEQDVC